MISDLILNNVVEGKTIEQRKKELLAQFELSNMLLNNLTTGQERINIFLNHPRWKRIYLELAWKRIKRYSGKMQRAKDKLNILKMEKIHLKYLQSYLRLIKQTYPILTENNHVKK